MFAGARLGVRGVARLHGIEDGAVFLGRGVAPLRVSAQDRAAGMDDLPIQ